MDLTLWDLSPNLKNLNRVAELHKNRFRSRAGSNLETTEHNFKWNQSCLRRGSNSLNSVSWPLFMYISIFGLSVCLSMYLSIWVSVCLSVNLSVCLSVYLSVCLSVYLSVCLSVYLSVWVSVYLSVCLFPITNKKSA